MKKLIAIFMCLIVVSSAYAKNDKDRNEFSITYGQYTIPQFAYVMGGVLGAAFTVGHFSFENPHLIGAAGVEYVHYVNNWLGFGGAAMCDYMTATALSVASDGTKTPNGKFQLGVVSVMPVMKFAWLNRAHVGLYSKLAAGAGYTFTGETEDIKDKFMFALQATPLGMDFGGEQFRGFVELGLGMQGIANVGVRWLF
jgi:hypothetical protein